MFIYVAVEGAAGADFATCIDAAGVTHTFSNADATILFLQSTPGKLVTFDGARTDFRLLADAATDGYLTDWVKAHVTSINHIDIHEAFVLEFGYVTPLDSFAAAVGTTKVARVRALHISACSAAFAVRRTVAGKPQTWILPATGVRTTVAAQAQAIQFPPDQSWMITPLKLSALWAWVDVVRK